MTARIFVPGDSGALALGADRVARALADGLAERGLDAEIVRNGSRGLYWLEPMVEVETARGRIAYGPVAAEDVAALLDTGLLDGGDHALRLGDPE
ncbi:MAG: formate dehydrogenase, partial [Nitratireductor sp.]